MIPNRIFLKGKARYDECKSAADLYPGMIAEKNSSGLLIPHSVAGGIVNPIRIVEEAALVAQTIKEVIASGDMVPHRLPQKGDVLLLLLKNGENAPVNAPLISGGDGTVTVGLAAAANTLHQITAASSNVTNTNAETTFSNGTLTILANTLKVGDRLHITGRATVSAQNSTDTHRIRVKLNSTVLVDSGALALDPTEYVQWDITLTVRAIGASGSIVVDGEFRQIVGATAADTPVAIAATALDTTAAATVTVTTLASAASTGNVVALQTFQVDLQRAVDERAFAFAEEAVDNSGGTGTSEFGSAAFIRATIG